MDRFQKNISNVFQGKMVEEKLSQTDFSTKYDIPMSTLKQVLSQRSNPRLSTLVYWSRQFHTTVWQILTGERPVTNSLEGAFAVIAEHILSFDDQEREIAEAALKTLVLVITAHDRSK